ncbi:hypothetical protein P3S68_015216 [Capsicum galapagoense]
MVISKVTSTYYGEGDFKLHVESSGSPIHMEKTMLEYSCCCSQLYTSCGTTRSVSH